jgi:hypothetical protein
MIGRVGLVDGSGLRSRELDDAVERAYRRYRESRTVREDPSWSAGLDLAYRPGGPDVPVEFVGVWDTVGALGVPTSIAFPVVRHSREQYEFLDVVLDPRINHARHAVSIDEMRGPYRPTLWRDVPAGQDVLQVWFPGDHEDVGGGHHRKGLSDVALDWMMREATSAVGLAFDRSRIPGFRPDPTARPHHLPGGPVGAALEVALEPRPRAVPRIDREHPVVDVAGSAYDLQASTGYRRTRTLAVSGATGSFDVPADRAWTQTGLYLEPGTYRFDAAGEWRDLTGSAGPDGHQPGGTGAFLRSVAEAGQSVLRAALRTTDTPLPGARRTPARPWMSLMGLVANEQTDAVGTVVHADELVAIGAGTTAEVLRPGYLYAFPNDAWGLYGVNSGTARVTVRRA